MTGNSDRTWWDAFRRARLTRVLAVYLGASFAVLQAVDIFTNQFGLPDWFFPGAAALLLIGLPIVIATAFVQARAVPSDTGSPAPSAASAAGGPVPEPREGLGLAARWLTWRRITLAAVGALALWGLVVTAYMGMRTLGIGPVGSLVAAGVLDERERVIVADFANNTDDPILGSVVTEAFRIDLAQSEMVTVVDPAFVESVLERMERGDVKTLSLELARELAIREGIKAVVGGDVNAVGSGYLLSARLVSAENGETLAAFRESADDAEGIIAAIDELSNSLRERAGESLRTIRANEPLDRVTTGSLVALKRYSQAVRILEEGDQRHAVALLEEAVQLDTAFAMAWRKLGVAALDQATRVEALRRAYRHRDRLTDRERYLTLGTYYSDVTDETDKAITAYETLLDLHPDDSWALNNLAVLYMARRNYAEAERLYARAIAVDSFNTISYGNLVAAQVAQGKFEVAAKTVERFAARYPRHPSPPVLTAQLASARGDYESARDSMLAYHTNTRGDRFQQANATTRLLELALIQGRLSDAERWAQELLDLAEDIEEPSLYLQGNILMGMQDVWLRREPDRGIQRVEAALARYPLDGLEPLNRPYLELAQLYAFAGRLGRARRMLARHTAELEEQDRVAREGQRLGTEATIHLFAGEHEKAIEAARRADRGSCAICILPLIGAAYDEAGAADSAVAIFERYVETPWLGREFGDGLFLAYTYERLARLYEARGDTQRAAHYYAALTDLWENADPELQPRVESARRALASLSGES